MTVLAFETSCDETSVAVVRADPVAVRRRLAVVPVDLAAGANRLTVCVSPRPTSFISGLTWCDTLICGKPIARAIAVDHESGEAWGNRSWQMHGIAVVGDNGHGKTNLLEAIYAVATLR